MMLAELISTGGALLIMGFFLNGNNLIQIIAAHKGERDNDSESATLIIVEKRSNLKKKTVKLHESILV